MKSERPAGVTAVADAFLLAAAYLFGVGLAMLVRPELVPLGTGRHLLGGFAFAGPHIFLLTAVLGAMVAFGLWRLHNWARWLAILCAMIGVVLLVPSVSSAVVFFRFGKLAWGALGTIVRVMIVQYFFQPGVKEAFQR
jgi:cell division protein FtsW (lipid II flippase)